MVTSFCNKIADIFLKNNIIEEEDKEIYQYGLEIFTSTFIGMLIVLTIGIFTHQIFETTIFYIVFATIRVYAGGYHASTYFRCKLFFTLNFILILSLSVFFSRFEVSLIIILPLNIWGFYTIEKYAPMENKNKSLTNADKKKYKKLSIWLYCFWSFMGMVLFFINIRIFWIITLSIFSVIVLMLLNKFIGKEEKADEVQR